MLAFLALALGVSASVPAAGQPYGLDVPTPVAPFLDGVFPTTTPQPGSVGWSVTDAFPSLTPPPLPTVLVIEPNPADNRLYLGSRDGLIVSIDNDPSVTESKPFMDLRDRAAVVWDGGFLGLVFHREFGQVGSPYEFTFYAYYATYCPTDQATAEVDWSGCNPGYPQGNVTGYFNTWLRLSRFTAYWDPVDGVYKGDATSERGMINIRLYNNSHRGGGPLFGLDGLLYVGIGDQYRYDTAQEITNTLEGGVMRLAVDIGDNGDGTWTCPTGSHLPRRLFQNVTGNADELSGNLYCLPDDNPWLDPGGAVMEEYWTIGHRNPHRITLDRVTGRIWSGEIGFDTREEVNVLEAGHNYGWPFREGKIEGLYSPPDPLIGILTEPVIDFTRDEAQSIIGGYVYRGTAYPELVGRYIAGDWTTRNIWAIDLDPGTMTATKELLTTFSPGGLATFGQDKDNELLLGSVSLDIPLQRLMRAGTPDPPSRLSQIGAFANMQTLEPHAAALPFLPDKFWSDNSGKARWIFVPNDGSHDQPDEQIVFSESGNWQFPTGTVLMKHFELGLDETNPSIETQLETRFLVLGEDSGWYGLTYRWRADQSDADLLTAGATADYTIQLAGGGTRTQTWVFPSRGQCLMCHNTGEGGPAGPRTHQLNRSLTYPATGRTDNQLRTWNHLGIFTPALNEVDIPSYLSARSVNDASASLELRARSYIDTNCSYCHRPETSNRAAFDGRLTVPLMSQGMIWGNVINPMGLADPYLVKPGDPGNSLISHRVALVGGGAMPPLAKKLADSQGVALLNAWIQRLDPAVYAHQGVGYEYYEQTGLTALPDFDGLTPVDTGAAGTFDLSPRQRDDDFAFRFTGVVEIPAAGDWTFYTSSDEGSELWLDAALVVDNDGLHPATEASGTLFVTAGYHDIVVTMFEATGSEVLNVSWEGPGTAKQPIAANRLFQQAPVPITNAPPLLTNPGAQLNAVGDAVDLALSASDPDGDALYFSAQGLPGGLAIDPDTGVIQGTLGIGSPGSHSVTIGASDGPDVVAAVFAWTVSDTTDPVVALTAPSAGSTLAGSVLVQASASDAGGVAGVQFRLDGAPLGAEDLAAPYELLWDTRLHVNGPHVLSAQVRDNAGNTAVASDLGVTVFNDPLASVAAWAFDETSGPVASDATGNGHDGAVSGAAWTTAGRFGGALLFDGVNDVVIVPDDDALDLGGAMTLSAWVYPTQAPAGWAPVVQKELDAYMLHTSSSGSQGAAAGATLSGLCCTMVYTGSSPPLDTWSHIAVTYDGVQLVYYVDGIAVTSAPASGLIAATTAPLRIGNNSYSGEAFAGRIDDVRIYDRALDALEIQADMSTSVVPPAADTTDPTVSLTAPAAGTVAGVVSVQASASDNVGVAGVQFLLGGVPLGAEDLAAPYELLWDTSVQSNGPYLLSARARDAAGNTGLAAGVAVSVDNVPDTTDPTVSLSAPADGATLTGSVLIEASAADDIGVVGVQFLLDGVPLGTEDLAPPYELLWNTSLHANGVYALSAEVRDAGGNTALASNLGVTVFNDPQAPVAAWAFDETSGPLASDATGNGHDGAVSGAVWTTAGRFGGALVFNGGGDVVVVPDDDALDLGGAMTLSAWVYPTQAPAGWAPVVQKELDAYMLHTSSSATQGAAAGATLGGLCCTMVYTGSSPPLDIWSHVAVTYDGAQLTYYVDGVAVNSAPASGLIEASTTPLRIGNNTYSGEAFAGRIDEVRVYDRALSESEIQSDLTTPVPEPGELLLLAAGLAGLTLLRRVRCGN